MIKPWRVPMQRRVMIALAAISILACVPPAEARRVHRSLFYSETPFGSLAWVSNTPTQLLARSRLAVADFSGETCMNLPASGAQWFIINHRSEDLDGQTGYFSIRVLYQFAPGERSIDARTGIHLQRNGNWFDAEGNQIGRGYERDSEQISLTEEDFMGLHNPEAGKEKEALAELEKAVGNWHLKPATEDDSSWADRYLYGPMLRAYLGESTGAISARLIRFTATSSSNSSEPVLFWLDPRGAASATVLVDAPRHTYEGSRRVYSVMFDGTCLPQ
jgi:hypothetical protein